MKILVNTWNLWDLELKNWRIHDVKAVVQFQEKIMFGKLEWKVSGKPERVKD